MIKYRKYGPNRYEPGKFFGLVFEKHPKYKGVDIYIGKYVYVFWTGYRK